MSLIKKLTSEPTIYVFTGLFILLMILTSSETFSVKLASVYGTMILIGTGISQLITPKIDINPIGGNTFQSLTWAIGAIFILTIIYNFLIYTARVSSVPVEGSAFERNFAAIKAQATLFSIDFEKIPFLSFMLFGVVIPILENKFLGRLFDFLTQTFEIPYTRLTTSVWAVILFCAGIFTWFHYKVRGINNNVDLLMTFIFGIAICLLIIKFRENESGTEMHVGWNLLSMLKG